MPVSQKRHRVIESIHRQRQHAITAAWQAGFYAADHAMQDSWTSICATFEMFDISEYALNADAFFVLIWRDGYSWRKDLD